MDRASSVKVLLPVRLAFTADAYLSVEQPEQGLTDRRSCGTNRRNRAAVLRKPRSFEFAESCYLPSKIRRLPMRASSRRSQSRAMRALGFENSVRISTLRDFVASKANTPKPEISSGQPTIGSPRASIALY